MNHHLMGINFYRTSFLQVSCALMNQIRRNVYLGREHTWLLVPGTVSAISGCRLCLFGGRCITPQGVHVRPLRKHGGAMKPSLRSQHCEASGHWPVIGVVSWRLVAIGYYQVVVCGWKLYGGVGWQVWLALLLCRKQLMPVDQHCWYRLTVTKSGWCSYGLGIGSSAHLQEVMALETIE